MFWNKLYGCYQGAISRQSGVTPRYLCLLLSLCLYSPDTGMRTWAPWMLRVALCVRCSLQPCAWPQASMPSWQGPTPTHLGNCLDEQVPTLCPLCGGWIRCLSQTPYSLAAHVGCTAFLQIFAFSSALSTLGRRGSCDV